MYNESFIASNVQKKLQSDFLTMDIWNTTNLIVVISKQH